MTDSTLRRHAYLILAHKNFGQLRKLLALLDDPRNDIFVHVDRKATGRPPSTSRLGMMPADTPDSSSLSPE